MLKARCKHCLATTTVSGTPPAMAEESCHGVECLNVATQKRSICRTTGGHGDNKHVPHPCHTRALCHNRWGMVIMPFGGFLSILWIAGINRYTLPDLDMRILNPTFGASAVLLFGVPESKLSQPRNFLGAT